MNKNLFLGMFAATGMLLATSCSNDELNAVQSGNDAQVTFTLGAEGGIASRTIGDGMSADLLYYAIYDANKTLITTIDGSDNGLLTKEGAFPDGSRKDVVQVTLAKGQEYTAVFWAQAEGCDAYQVEAAENAFNVNVTYAGKKNNDETRDAFFKAETFTVTGDDQIPVVLTRPFAQINVGVTKADWEAAVNSGIDITESKVVIKNAANSINLLTGEVSGEETVTYDFATIPAKFDTPETLEVDVNGDDVIQEDEKYKYLSMSYILTDNDAERTTLEADGLQFTFKSAGADIVFDEGLHAVPVQRNWRTNILGKLLTGDIQFNIEIDQEFEDDYNLVYPDADDASIVSVTTAQELTDAIKNATSDVTIYFANDITGEVVAEQQADVDVIVNGNGYTYNGTIDIYGHARSTGVETLTFTNIAFETSGVDEVFISCNTTESAKRYAHNVTVENCSFTATGAALYTAQAAKYRQCYNMSFVNCTATGLHSLVWATGGNNMTIDGVTLEDCKNGLSFGTNTDVTVKNSAITAVGDYSYGIRVDASGAYNMTVTDCIINADCPIMLRKATGNYTLALTGNNTLTTEEDFQIIPTDSEYGLDDNGNVMEVTYATGNITITGAEGFKVYSPKGVFEAALADPNVSEITLTDPITSVGTGFNVTKDVVFNMEGKVFNAGSDANSKNYALQVSGEHKVEVNDANFTRAGISASAGAEVIFNSGSINHKPERSSRYIFFAYDEGTTITIEDGTFTNDRAKNSFFYADGGAVIYVKGGTFNGAVSNKNVVTSNGGKVIISGGTFNFDPTTWLAEGYIATQNGKTWTVSAQ